MSDLDDPRPVAPVQPDLDDCCNRGCYPCVFDTYDDAMDRYRAALKLWESRHAPKPKGLFSRVKKPKAP
jgi:hypothetical protein